MVESGLIQSNPSVPDELRRAALFWLAERDANAKAAGVAQLFKAMQDAGVSIDSQSHIETSHSIPGQPDKPELVPPRLVERRSMATTEGRAALIHALTHIEFNAINLALDAIWRFADMPQDYYFDWLKVAHEEAYHFGLLRSHLESMGYAYGDFSAHNSLWEMVARTTDDVLARMALVPRTLEARGLDASPPLRAKLAQIGDMAAAEILDIILRDEVGHVAIGNRWYGWLCEQRGLEPIETYQWLAKKYEAPRLRGPFNLPARRAAGFTEQELSAL